MAGLLSGQASAELHLGSGLCSVPLKKNKMSFPGRAGSPVSSPGYDRVGWAMQSSCRALLASLGCTARVICKAQGELADQIHADTRASSAGGGRALQMQRALPASSGHDCFDSAKLAYKLSFECMTLSDEERDFLFINDILIPGLEDGEEEVFMQADQEGDPASYSALMDDLSFSSGEHGSSNHNNLDPQTRSDITLNAELAQMQEINVRSASIGLNNMSPGRCPSGDLHVDLLSRQPLFTSNDRQDLHQIDSSCVNLLLHCDCSTQTSTVSESSCKTQVESATICKGLGQYGNPHDSYASTAAAGGIAIYRDSVMEDYEQLQKQGDQHINMNEAKQLQSMIMLRTADCRLINDYKVASKSSEDTKKRSVARGPWTPEEDSYLRQLVERYGDKKWSVIAQHLQGRIGKQCRERWQNHLRPDIKVASITPTV
ncbi:hypothetical protein L7F22_060747 [Adiantum nelumboides]|nr:hypothetical protein [Adiantum nelumboides]